MKIVSEGDALRRLITCTCGRGVSLVLIRISSRSIIESLPKEFRDKAQSMREKGKKPAAVVGSCATCGESYITLVSTGQEEGHFDTFDFRRNLGSSKLKKVS